MSVMCQKVMAKLSGFKVDLKVIYIMPFKFNVGLLNAYKLTFAIERSNEQKFWLLH